MQREYEDERAACQAEAEQELAIAPNPALVVERNVREVARIGLLDHGDGRAASTRRELVDQLASLKMRQRIYAADPAFAQEVARREAPPCAPERTRPRSRGAGRPAARRSSAGATRGDPDDPDPGEPEPPPARPAHARRARPMLGVAA